MLHWMTAKGPSKYDPAQERRAQEKADGRLSGVESGTLVATSMGWRPVEAITAGDMVLTFDAGMQMVTNVTRERLWTKDEPCPKAFWPLEIPAGALGNREALRLLANQSIMVESDAAEDMFGDPFSLLPANAFEGICGIERVPPQSDFEVVVLQFASEQIVFAKDGTLLFCPSSRDILDCVFETASDPLYTVLPFDQARTLAGSMQDEIQNTCRNAASREYEFAMA